MSRPKPIRDGLIWVLWCCPWLWLGFCGYEAWQTKMVHFWLLLGVGGFFLGQNWFFMTATKVTGQFMSGFPFIGAAVCFLGLLFGPYPLTRWLSWLAFLLDPHIIVAIVDLFRRLGKRNK